VPAIENMVEIGTKIPGCYYYTATTTTTTLPLSPFMVATVDSDSVNVHNWMVH
jgi:hypothetical protein